MNDSPKQNEDKSVGVPDGAADDLPDFGLLYEEIYGNLRAIAQRHLADERSGHTLQATALVHEVFLRLAPDRRIPWKNREHLVAAAAETMRRVLLDHAKARGRIKRGVGLLTDRIPLDILELAKEQDGEMIEALDNALAALAHESPDAAAVIKLRFYACQNISQTAVILGMSPRSVDRAWSYGRAWLFRKIREEMEP